MLNDHFNIKLKDVSTRFLNRYKISKNIYMILTPMLFSWLLSGLRSSFSNIKCVNHVSLLKSCVTATVSMRINLVAVKLMQLTESKSI